MALASVVSAKMKEASQDGAGTVVIGTYDGALLGLRGDTGAQKFGYAPHAGCVKVVGCSQSGRLATGGTDHMVRLFDLVKGLEVGELQEHDDTVTCVEFWGPSSFISGGADGLVCVWRCSDWELLLKFRAHKSAVACIAIHPSGRLMASAGKDSSVRLWDLTRGTSAAIVPMDEPIELLQWSPLGGRIAALGAGSLSLVDVAQSGSVAVYRDPESQGIMRVALSAAMFVREGEVLLGDGKGELRVLSFQPGNGQQEEGAAAIAASLREVCRLPSDSERNRVKAIARGAPASVAADARGDVVPFAVGTSTGRVELWRFTASGPSSQLTPERFQRLKVVETKVRLTCLEFWPGACLPLVETSEKVDGQAKKRQKKGAV